MHRFICRLHPLAPSLFGAALLAACVQSGPQRSGDGPPRRMSAEQRGAIATPLGLLVASFDADGDGRVDLRERDAGIAREWARLSATGADRTGPMEVSRWSAGAMGRATAVPGFLSFDADGDGNVAKREFTSRMVAEVDRHDTDGDGSISRAELLADVTPPRNAERPRRNGGGQARGRSRRLTASSTEVAPMNP